MNLDDGDEKEPRFVGQNGKYNYPLSQHGQVEIKSRNYSSAQCVHFILHLPLLDSSIQNELFILFLPDSEIPGSARVTHHLKHQLSHRHEHTQPYLQFHSHRGKQPPSLWDNLDRLLRAGLIFVCIFSRSHRSSRASLKNPPYPP